MRPVDKSIGSVERGVALVKRWLKIHTRVARQRDVAPGEIAPPIAEDARLYVSPRCKRTIDEFGMYRRRRDPRNTELVLEDIQDGHDHAMDSLRYPIANHFPDVITPVRDVRNLPAR